MKLYLSGPMSGIEDHNFPAFNLAAKGLRAKGLEVVNPAELGLIEGGRWAQYLKRDIKLLMDCDAIYMLPDWTSSEGASLEYSLAQRLELQIFHYGSKDQPQP